MKKTVAFLGFLFTAAISLPLFSQGIMTANDYLKSVSDVYATITDYEADVEIEAGKSEMTGKVSFKRPEMLRIDFSEPADQVILFNGDDLTIYLPGSSAILDQSVEGAAGVSATPQGLNLLKRYYSVSYLTGQDAEPLEDGSDEMVVNLVFTRRSASEAFTQINIAIERDTKLIRRVVATTPQNDKFTFDFYNYKLNTNISDQRFIYEPPSSANNYNNFLFSE